jgi:hypothetical protein
MMLTNERWSQPTKWPSLLQLLRKGAALYGLADFARPDRCGQAQLGAREEIMATDAEIEAAFRRCGPFARGAGKFMMMSCAPMLAPLSTLQNLCSSRNIEGDLS